MIHVNHFASIQVHVIVHFTDNGVDYCFATQVHAVVYVTDKLMA